MSAVCQLLSMVNNLNTQPFFRNSQLEASLKVGVSEISESFKENTPGGACL